ncbi:hypothetical protein QQF64_019940 [Cirrhinus molitorella]|uniref:Secreted protein n=1 Tax=Cirrhinus molitorella TaxID=172907 RepID=A0ABR3LK72_9TELE
MLPLILFATQWAEPHSLQLTVISRAYPLFGQTLLAGCDPPLNRERERETERERDRRFHGGLIHSSYFCFVRGVCISRSRCI